MNVGILPYDETRENIKQCESIILQIIALRLTSSTRCKTMAQLHAKASPAREASGYFASIGCKLWDNSNILRSRPGGRSIPASLNHYHSHTRHTKMKRICPKELV